MANLKEKLFGLIDNGASTAMSLIDTMNETINSINWDAQLNSLNEMKDSLIKKGNELLGDFNELMKQVKNNISDFEVTVPFDEALGEKFECKVEGNKLIIEVTFKDENTERSSKTVVNIPQNCDVEKMTHKYNQLTKSITVIIPKNIVEHVKEEEAKPNGYKLNKNSTTARKKLSVKDEETRHTENKLLKKFHENTRKGSGVVHTNEIPRSANGRFAKRN